MFDLIDECGKDLKNYGYKIKEYGKYGITIASLIIESEDKSKEIGLDLGEYYIINCPNLYDYGMDCSLTISQLLEKQIKKLLKDFNVVANKKVLIVGLGNPDIASDRLGKEVFDNIEIDVLSKNNNVYKFCPNIYFSTGIETIEMVDMFVKNLKIDFLIIIDSLTTNSLYRLGTSFQITTTGMTPGSGVNRFGKRISMESIGIPCISIGVPFMIFANELDKNYKYQLILSPKDIKENVELSGYMIANALNKSLKR